jgi:hypothetical protein
MAKKSPPIDPRIVKIMKKVRGTKKQKDAIRLALESILESDAITRIKKTVPKVEYDPNPLSGDYPLYGKGKFVFKISISTVKTRKTFGIRG